MSAKSAVFYFIFVDAVTVANVTNVVNIANGESVTSGIYTGASTDKKIDDAIPNALLVSKVPKNLICQQRS